MDKKVENDKYLELISKLKYQSINDEVKSFDKNFLLQNFNIKECLESRNCGKLILSGEHAVVYGAYAVAIPLNLKLRLNLFILDRKDKDKDNLGTNNDHESFTVFSNANSIDVHKNLRSILKQAIFLLSIDLKKYRSFILIIDSEFPLGSGLGGSAAISVSMIEALSKIVDIKLGIEDKIKLSNELEKINHTSPSGIDVSTIIHQTPIIYKNSGFCSKIEVSESKIFEFLLIDTLEKSSTKEMILKASPFFKQGGSKLLDRFDKLSLSVKTSLETKNIEKISYSINELSCLLEKAGLFTESIKYICTKSLELGALASKPSGACGGGVVMVLLDPKISDLEYKLRDIFKKFKIFKFFI